MKEEPKINKMLKKENKNKKGRLAITQILILVIATFAFAWMIGSSVGFVSGVDPEGGRSQCELTAEISGECYGEEEPEIKDPAFTCHDYYLQKEEKRCPGDKPFCCISYGGGDDGGDTGDGNGGDNYEYESCAGGDGVCLLESACMGEKITGDCFGGLVCCIESSGSSGSGWLGNTLRNTGTTLFNYYLMSRFTSKDLSIPKDLANFGQKVKGIWGKGAEASVSGDIEAPIAEMVELPEELAGSAGKTNFWTKIGQRITTFFTGHGENLGFSTVNEAQIGWKGLSAGQAVGTIFTNVALAVGVAILITKIANKYSSVRNAGDIKVVAWTGAYVGTALVIATVVAQMGPPGWIAAAVVIFFTGVYMLVGYQLYSQQVFAYQPSLWQPPTGGNNCEKCNDLVIAGEHVCSEYICHTYGTTCNWTNSGTEYELCVEDVQDGIPPIITPLEYAYDKPVFNPPEAYSYASSRAGARIVYEPHERGCVPAFTSVKIAVETNETAHCKIDVVPHDEDGTSTAQLEMTFTQMQEMAEGNVYTKTHTLTLDSLAAASKNSMQASGYGWYTDDVRELYIRCKDRGGAMNEYDYSVGFCVDEIDMEAPRISGTNPETGSYLSYGTNFLENFLVYTNEPAICKWDFEQKEYEYMLYDFDKCSTNLNEKIDLGSDKFGCKVNLTGLKPAQENVFYIACRDQPELIGTVNEPLRKTSKPEEIIFKGTQPLGISGVAIDGQENNSVIKPLSDKDEFLLEVATYAGAEDGKARCSYSNDQGEEKDYSLFYNEGSLEYLNINSHPLYLTNQGNYKYYIICEDIAENEVSTMINFSIEFDLEEPEVIRVYRDGEELKIITNEKSKCYYTTNSCDYNIQEGTEMTSSDGISHSTEWNIEKDLYIKCVDIPYGNIPSGCNIIVRPFEIHEAL